MINRVLIRIKVIQLLYSYLLTSSEFKIQEAPNTTSRDKRVAYAVYLRLLLLILELSGYSARPSGEVALKEAADNKHLHGNKMVRALAADDEIRRIILRGNSGIEQYDPLLSALYKKITSSAIYATYSRSRKRDIEADVRLWTTLLATDVAKDPDLIAIARGDEIFTTRGFNDGVKMAIASLNSFCDNRMALTNSLSALKLSLEKAYELYIALLQLPVALTRVEEERIETARNKHLPTPEELNPSLRFVENAYVAEVSENPYIKKYFDKNFIDWSNEPIVLRNLLDSIRASQFYKDYMEAPSTDRNADFELWRQLMKNVVIPSDELAELLEDKSVYWNDDLDIVSTFVVKTIRRFATATPDSPADILPPFKDEEDERFGEELFTLAVDHRDEYRDYIDKFINPEQWDSERLAFMDIVIMITAIAEILNYPAIPLAVSLNEYIEIANAYSTPKSGQFINGILTSVIKYLRSEGILHKEFFNQSN